MPSSQAILLKAHRERMFVDALNALRSRHVLEIKRVSDKSWKSAKTVFN